MHAPYTKFVRLMSAISLAFLLGACQKNLESTTAQDAHAVCDQRLKFAVMLSIGIENPDGMAIEFTDSQGAVVQSVSLPAEKRHDLPGTTPVESYWDDVPYCRFVKMEDNSQLLLSALPEKIGTFRAVARMPSGVTREAQVNVVADPCGHPVTQNIHFDIP